MCLFGPPGTKPLLFFFSSDNLKYLSKCASVQSVQSLSRAQLFVTPWVAARQASLSITNSQSSLKLIHRVSDAIQPSHPVVPFSCPQSLPASVFSNESTLRMRWPKYWSFSFSISPSNEYSGLISFRIDQFDLLAVQVTLKSLLQHHSSKASILRYSGFFTVQLSHPYIICIFILILWKRSESFSFLLPEFKEKFM